MTELRDFENELRATLADVVNTTDEPSGLADRLVAGAPRRRTPHRVQAWLGHRWVPPALAAAAVAIVAVATVATVSATLADRPTRPTHPTPTLSPPPTSSAPTSPPTSSAPTSSPPPSTSPPPSARPPAERTAADWDIDGDSRPDDGRLVFLGGTGPNNWQLVVDLSRLGRQTIPFTGQIALPGSADLSIAGSVDADHDGHAEIFVMDQYGANTESWTIFKLGDQHIVQVSAASQPVDLTVGGSVTHADGFRCAGGTLTTTSEALVPPEDKTLSYRRTTYAWDGVQLRQTSQQNGTFTGPLDAGVDCGDLPQVAPTHVYQPSTSPTTSPPTASGRWTEPQLVITAHSLGAVTRGVTPTQAEAAAGTKLSMIGDGIYRPTDHTISGTTVLQFSWGATCFDATRTTPGPGTTVTTSAGIRLGDLMSRIATIYGSAAKPFTADPTWTGPGNIPAGTIVQSGDGVLLFVGSSADHRGGTITSIRGAEDAFHASSVFC